MRPVLSRDEMRNFDRYATESGRVPALLLMENAGRGAADTIYSRFATSRRVVVCCGGGNNGGDGFVVARRLMTLGVRVGVLCNAPTNRLGDDARIMREAYEALGGKTEVLSVGSLEALLGARASEECLVVDALLGTGLEREIQSPLREVIESINCSRAPVVSLDTPSGLHADTGAVLGVAVRAAFTVCFGHAKLGLMTPVGLDHTGELVIVDIGVPPALYAQVGHSAWAVDSGDLASMLQRRGPAAHKGHSGRIAVLAGSPGTVGAARLVARGALRAGAGLVTVVNVDAVITRLEGQVEETMTARLDEAAPADSLERIVTKMDALAVGPGLGVGETSQALVRTALDLPCAKVFDADALTILAEDPAKLRACKGNAVITPHPGEAARLLGVTPADIESDRFGSIRRLVELTECVTLLKGARTLIAGPEQLPHINLSGSPALATGGAGDVLTGIIAALLAHGEPFSAALLGAGVHGLCGELWSSRLGADRGMLASEIADEVPRAFAQLSTSSQRLTD